MNKIFIEDLTKNVKGLPENEIIKTATIRFEIDKIRYRVLISDSKLVISKASDSNTDNGNIKLETIIGNKIILF